MSDRVFDLILWGLLGSLVVIWLVHLILKPRSDRAWEEYHARQLAMLESIAKGEDFVWPPPADPPKKEEPHGQ